MSSTVLPPRARVLLINYEFPPLGGGAANATENLAWEMAALGIEVRVLTSGFRDLPRHEESRGVSVFRIRTLRRRADRSSILEMLAFLAAALPAVSKMSRNWRADVAIAFFGLPCGPIGWFLKTVYGTPYIISLRGGDVPGFAYEGISLYHRLCAPLISLLWRHATAVVANSVGLADLARRFAPRMDIPVIPNGVDPGVFSPEKPRSEGSVLRLLFVGRLVHQKGLDILFQALAALPDKQSFVLHLVGDGEARPDLETLAKALGIDPRLRFLGWIDRGALPDLYRDADVFVFPSRNEGMPNVVLEAMAAGLAVLATRIAGTEELIIDGESGLLVPVLDVEALTDGIVRLATDHHLRRRLGDAARSRVLTSYSWRTAAENYLKLAGIR